jgi:hypothetical protein
MDGHRVRKILAQSKEDQGLLDMDGSKVFWLWCLSLGPNSQQSKDG